MSFLNPLVLLGLVAAGIPLLIHLFNFRKPQRVDFSSLVFLRELQKTSMQRVRIKQWLLLALRVLAVACLVLAFARPMLRGGAAARLGGSAGSALAVVVDNSLSMTARDGAGAYLDQAAGVAARLLRRDAEEGSRYLFTTGGEWEGRFSEADASALPEINASAGARPLSVVLQKAARALQSDPLPGRTVVLITDLQQSTLSDTLIAAFPPGVALNVIALGAAQTANVSVQDVRLDGRILEPGRPVRMTATLLNHGEAAVQNALAGLYLGDERVAQASATLRPHEPTEVPFTLTPRSRGWLLGSVQLEDDAFPADNVRYFTLHVPETRELLIVRGEGQNTAFLELALSSELTRGRVGFSVETTPESQLGAADLRRFDAVILAGPRALTEGERALLATYVQEGGGVLFFPGNAASAEGYAALLGSLGGGRVAGFVGEAGTGAPARASFAQVDFEHPLFQGMLERGDVEESAFRLESPEIRRMMTYRPGTGSEQTLITLSGGSPFLQEIRSGEGVVLVMAVAPDEAWSDLPTRGLFVPLLYHSLFYLSSSESVGRNAFIAGRGGDLRLRGVSPSPPLQLVHSNGEAFTATSRPLFGATLLQIPPELDLPGIYDVVQNDQSLEKVALNLDPRESDLRRADPGEAAAAFERALGTSVEILSAQADPAGAAARVLRREQGAEVWNVLLYLALAFLVAEAIVSRGWHPETAPA